MIEVDVYNSSGKKTSKIKLDQSVFGCKMNEKLLNQIIHVYANNKRLSQANTKTRGEVRGGGKKPWRQKGTGRARAGSSRSPIWQGGGITFGPTSEKNYKRKVTQSMKRKGTCVALSAKLSKNRLLVLDKLTIDKAKTKELVGVLDNLPFDGSALLVLSKGDEKILRMGRNIPYLKILEAANINAYNLLKFNYLIAFKESIQVLEDRLILKKEEVKTEKGKKETSESKTKLKVNKNDSKK